MSSLNCSSSYGVNRWSWTLDILFICFGKNSVEMYICSQFSFRIEFLCLFLSYISQLASREVRSAGHTSYTVPVFPGWTAGRQRSPQPTTTPGRSVTSASPACTPPAPVIRAAAAPAPLPSPPSHPQPTPVRIPFTISPQPHRKTSHQTPVLLLRPPPLLEWTKRSPSSIKSSLMGWKWRAVVLFGEAWLWALRHRPRIIPSRPTQHTLCPRRTSTAAVCFILVPSSVDPLRASHLNVKARRDRAQVSFISSWLDHEVKSICFRDTFG